MNEIPQPSPITLILESEKKFARGAEIRDFGVVENRAVENFRFEQTDFINGCFQNISFSSLTLRTVYFLNTVFFHSGFVKTEASHYLFEKSEFRSLAFSESDFSGGSFQDVVFNRVEFLHTDFALCEFKNVKFIHCRFINASFNASVFENTEFTEPFFQDSTFHAVEGLDESQLALLKGKGGEVSLPFQADLMRIMDFLIHKINRPVLAFIFVLIGFALGFYSRDIRVELKRLITMEANPLSAPFQMLYDQAGRV